MFGIGESSSCRVALYRTLPGGRRLAPFLAENSVYYLATLLEHHREVPEA